MECVDIIESMLTSHYSVGHFLHEPSTSCPYLLVLTLSNRHACLGSWNFMNPIIELIGHKIGRTTPVAWPP